MRAKIKLYTPHVAQKQLHDSVARFIIVSCGRRFGKTMMAINELVKHLWENKGERGYWIAPVYRQCRLAHRMISHEFGEIIASATLNPMEIRFMNGSVIQFASTENSSNTRGDHAHIMIIDEASMVSEEAWTNVLRPMLSDTGGRAIIISTPRGMNWFHNLFIRGQDPEYPDYESFKFPTSANPYIPPAEIEEVRNSLPHDVFKQEYLAEFLEDGGQVFRNVSSCVQGELEEPIHGKSYTVSYDIARVHDFSAIVVMDNDTGHVAGFDRFNRIDYSLQVKRVEAIARKYNNARVICDSTGVGDPITESLQKTGLNVEGYQFTNTSKQQLIEHLAVLIEKKEISYPNIKVLINELMSYQYEITRAGNMRYNAPSGMHDDCVIALALAAWGAKHGSKPMVRWL